MLFCYELRLGNFAKLTLENWPTNQIVSRMGAIHSEVGLE